MEEAGVNLRILPDDGRGRHCAEKMDASALPSVLMCREIGCMEAQSSVEVEDKLVTTVRPTLAVAHSSFSDNARNAKLASPIRIRRNR